ncbi:MAG: SusC/RagA family TonB-linked outer membrane protein [Cyclobacteriaceae bacterium]|nr:SusC/RagA family TonB-linked outer membrane protein [Cyclobacteriaceae bacterium HetDA_MAG_MS6]
MKLFSYLALLLLSSSLLFAQGVTSISGKVYSQENDESLPGVSIYVKGTSVGTISDIDGAFKLNVPDSAKSIIVSFVGFQTREILLLDKTSFDIGLATEIVGLETIIVTALGIKKEERAIGYASQQVKGDQLSEVKEINVINSLSGKVAGVSINQAGTGPGGTSKVVIRGFSSVAGGNSPLYVVDGVPMTNPQGGGVEFGGIDLGDGISNLNPDDIESINVLKGASASALYGSRGQNGVIMITTKKGAARKGVGVDVSSSFILEEPQVLPDFQDTYGRGSGGNFPIDNAGNFSNNTRVSWGERMSGQTEVGGNPLVNWTGNPTPYSAQEDNIKGFFRTGKTYINSLTLSGGNEDSQGRLSISHLKNEGIMPNSDLTRVTVNLRVNHKLSDKLSFDGKINYINQEAFNRPNLALSPDNPMNSLIQMPRSIRLNDLKDFRNPDLSPRVYTNATGVDFWQNPYWAVNLNTNEDNRDRILGFVSLKYDITDWASIQLRTGTDFYNDIRENRNATGTIYRVTPDKSFYSLTTARVEERNSDFLVMINPKMSGPISISGNVGGNILRIETESLTSTTQGLNIPDFFVLQNGISVISSENESVREVQSLYGSAQIDLSKLVFLEFSARNDWSSALPEDNRSYFYPSVSSSFIFSDALALENNFFSYGKIRASVAQVGNDTGPHRLDLNYFVNTLSHGDQTFGQVTTTQPPADLQPEETTSFEAGLDLAFWQRRLTVDATYYTAGTRNQIFSIPISKTSGFQEKVINGGLIQNQGVEILLTGQVIEQQDLKWSTTINFSRNQSKVKELSDDVNIISFGQFDQFGVRIQAEVGEPFGTIYADKSYLRDENGNRIIGTNGLPIPDTEGGIKKIGNFQPDWLAGITNSISYKNLSLRFLIDIRKGGDIFSFSNAVAAANGNAEFTEDQRAEWYAGAGGFIAKGVTADGSPNTREVDPQEYWQFVGGQASTFAEEFVYDASFVKLREVSLAYRMPKRFLENTIFTKLTFSLVGRNLFFIHKNTPGFDPEATFNSGNTQGIEAFAFPSTRSVGFNLSFSL